MLTSKEEFDDTKTYSRNYAIKTLRYLQAYARANDMAVAHMLLANVERLFMRTETEREIEDVMIDSINSILDEDIVNDHFDDNLNEIYYEPLSNIDATIKSNINYIFIPLN